MQDDPVNNPDIKVVAFLKALGQKESNNQPLPPNTRITQTEGSVGRFQFLPETFNRYAKQYYGGLNPETGTALDIRDDKAQKYVAYAYVKDKMKQGYSPYDVAASWNAGEGRINDWQNMKGTNKYGNKFDVPAYADEVVHNFKEYGRQMENQGYTPVTFDPRLHTLENMAKDNDVASQLRDMEVEREKSLQAYKDKDPLIPFLDPVTDAMGDFSEGFNKNAQRTIGNIATTANELFDFTDNPMLIRGTKSNDQYINKATESDNTTQTVGDLTTEGIKLAAEMYTGTKLANVTMGALAGGAGGAALQRQVLSQGLRSVATQFGVGAIESIPFVVDQLMTDPEKFGIGKDVLLPGAIAAGAGLLFGMGRTAVVGNIATRVGKLRALGKMDEAEKLINSREYAMELARSGITNEKQLIDAAKKEIPVVRQAVQELVPTTSALKVSNMSDDAIQQFAANFSKTLDSNGNFNTIDDINRMRKAASELMDGSEELSKSLSKQLTLAGKNIDLPKMKDALLNDIEKRVASREILPDEGQKFANFVERNFLTKPSKNGALFDLHKLRKNLNLDFTHNDYDASRYLADKIRKVVGKLPESAEMRAYKNANKVYGDLQDAEFILAKMNKKGSQLNKSTLASLSGVLASGGGFAPVQYYLGQRLGTHIADKLKRVYTPRLVNNKFSQLGTNPLVDAHRMVNEAITSTGKKITKLEGKITKQKAQDFMNTVLNAETPKDLIAAKKLLRDLAKHPEFTTYSDELSKAAAKINTIKELKLFATGKTVGKDFTNLKVAVNPKRPQTPAEKAKESMLRTSIGLPAILTAVLGVGMATQADTASAMTTEEPKQELNFIQKMFQSEPVEAVPTEGPQIKPAPVEKPVEKKKGVIGGYDIGSYATDPQHEAKIEKIYNGVTEKRDFSTSTGIQEAIKDNAPKSKITGKMIIECAEKHDVDPKILFAIMLQDSQLGTKGMGARNNNPGNVAQFDHLKHPTKGYKTMKDGVEAVARWLKGKKVEE